ncbi:MAG: hypothetical protein KDA73_12620 [Rhodobacteraceae bacterium]|nr:hypothetical protein [Paracoccaceae bacterium]
MSRFLQKLIRRANGTEDALKASPRALFEPAGSGLSMRASAAVPPAAAWVPPFEADAQEAPTRRTDLAADTHVARPMRVTDDRGADWNHPAQILPVETSAEARPWHRGVTLPETGAPLVEPAVAPTARSERGTADRVARTRQDGSANRARARGMDADHPSTAIVRPDPADLRFPLPDQARSKAGAPPDADTSPAKRSRPIPAVPAAVRLTAPPSPQTHRVARWGELAPAQRDAPENVVHVTIEHFEVRALVGAPPKPEPRTRAVQEDSLADYARRRQERRR